MYLQSVSLGRSQLLYLCLHFIDHIDNIISDFLGLWMNQKEDSQSSTTTVFNSMKFSWFLHISRYWYHFFWWISFSCYWKNDNQLSKSLFMSQKYITWLYVKLSTQHFIPTFWFLTWVSVLYLERSVVSLEILATSTVLVCTSSFTCLLKVSAVPCKSKKNQCQNGNLLSLVEYIKNTKWCQSELISDFMYAYNQLLDPF